MSTLVILGYVWPEPCSSAAGSRMLSLIRLYLDKGWQVIFASSAQLSPHRFTLTDWGVTEQQVALNDDSFQLWLAGINPTAVLFDRFMLEEQFGWRVEQACPQAMRILDMEDCHALRQAREHCFKAAKALDSAALNSDLAVREIAAIYRCDLTLVISEFEMQLLQQHFQVPAMLLCYCPFWLSELPDNYVAFEQRQHFVAIGNFRHAPNWQAVLWLKQEIWPQIRQLMPKAELHIYGAYPPPKATALHNAAQGFLVKGWAADALQVLTEARICLAPLAFGAGLKGKLLDAMQAGTPSISTDIGVEGMTIATGWAGIVANSSVDIAAAAISLYQDPQRWQQAQQQGLAILQQRFSADNADLVWQRLSDGLQQIDALRAANFTGVMLRSHAYRSTKYMGQWIEAKNRRAE
ncbi:glycosyltransferase [Arsukibacterium sp.]|uniref:glycosyltransferase n=1 Tax=Arsukibacterium sp. TaxID=1977258 RepID=UPI002FD934CF